MRLTARLSIALAVVGVTLGLGAAPRAQGPAPGSEALERALRGGIFDGAPVVGAPFSATATLTWQRPGTTPPRRAATKYFRDAAGRVRVEQAFTDEREPQVARRLRTRAFVTPQPAGRDAYLVDDTGSRPLPRGLAASIVGGWTHLVLPVSASCSATWYLPLAEIIDTYYPGADRGVEQPLGERVIEGLNVTGRRTRATWPAGAFGLDADLEVTSERWVSPELRVLVYSRIEDAVAGTFEVRLSRVDRAEPPRDLFTVAEGVASATPMTPHHSASPYTLPRWAAEPCRGFQ